MPITLNHSNISVQYSSDKSYIIETVKSDLYIGVPTAMTTNTEPTITSPAFTESVRVFTHSGGTETQTTHTITIGQNTICDIMMIGAGGGGGVDRAGGGGSGALILSIGNILSGTYTIKVGNGGTGAVYTSASAPGQNGFDCEILNSAGTVIFRAKGGGGGQSLSNDVATSGGSGGGASSQNMNGGLGGIPVSTNIVNGITTGPVVTTTYGVYGNRGGRNINPFTGNYDILDGAGGGGIGEGGSGSGSLVSVDSQFVTNNGGKGGDGLYFATINGINYNFKNYFNVNGVQDGTTGNFFIGGGGGGGDTNSGTPGIGGKGGGGAGGDLDQNGFIASGFGSGGGGAGGRSGGNPKDGGKGSAGIVAIKLRTIVNAAIPEGNPITHKTLNFAYDPTKYAEYQAQQKTGVGGWRIVRFLPPNLGRWYQGDYINTSTFTIPTIGTPYNYTNEWAVPFGTFDEMFFGTFDMTYWLYCLKTSVLGSYSNSARPIIKSSSSSTPYSALWYNRATGSPEDPWIRIIQEDNSSIVYGENNNSDHPSLRNTYGGMCVLVRDSTASTTIPNPNQYTLSVQAGTSIQVNNQTAKYLSGNYTINLGATQSSVLGLSGQTNPFPLANGTTIAIRYSMILQVPILDPVGAQWTYSSNNTNVYHMGSVGIGTTNPEYQLDVRGAIYSSIGGITQTGLTTWSITSDRRIKDNITRASYDKCLENVKNIELYNFTFKNNCVNTNDKHQLGFIAQEVQQVYPKAVEVGKMILNTNEKIDNLLTLNTTQIDYTLYGAVKNIIEKIEDIDNDLENIEKAVGMGMGEPAPNAGN